MDTSEIADLKRRVELLEAFVAGFLAPTLTEVEAQAPLAPADLEQYMEAEQARLDKLVKGCRCGR